MSMPIELIITLAVVIIAWLVLTAVIKIFKVGITTALSIIALLLILQFAFGIKSPQIWQQMQLIGENLSQYIWELINSY